MRLTKKEKNILNIIVEVACIAFIVACFLFVSYKESHYTKDMTVYDMRNEIITFEDAQGNLWDYETDIDAKFERGQKYKVTMFTNHTDSNIYDDEITRIKKAH